jgi:NAD(P)-dependent dehydrogenase (short-subunit alcohol dehydrogenase family)
VTLTAYDLSGRAALVTGSTQGIGLAAAKLFAANGARVIIHGSTAAKCEAVARGIKGAVPAAWDLSDVSGAESFAQRVAAACGGKLDVLVHNAALCPVGTIESQSMDEWRRVIDIDVNSAYEITKRLLPCLKAAGNASIVFVSSVVVRVCAGDSPAYTTSKAAQVGLARHLAAELGPAGIRVNVVLPGLVDTPGSRKANKPEDFETYPRTKQMINVAIQPEDVAHAVAFLCSPAARAITAACLDVNGGMAAGG